MPHGKPGRIVSISVGNARTRVIAKRDALTTEHLDLVPPIARRIHSVLPPSFDLDDLIQTGRIGLMRAAIRFRPELHGDTPFSAFARAFIRGEIMMSIRRRHYRDATHQPMADAPDRADTPDMEATIDRQRVRARIERAELTERQRIVLDTYYSPSMPTFAEVADALEIAEWKVRQDHLNALEILRTECKIA
jgi:RNA polymerase sigma factor (sigma-70 family)